MTRQVRVRTVEDAMQILKSPEYAHTQQVVATLMTGLEGELPVLSVADGEIWRRTHDALVGFFTPTYVRRNYLPEIIRITEETLDAEGAIFDLEACMRRLTVRVMWYVLFRDTMTFDEAEMVAVQTGIISSSRNPTGQREAGRKVSDFLMGKIRHPNSSPLLESLASRFMDLDPAHRGAALVSELKFLIIAGVETTAASLVFTICEIANEQTD